MRRGSEYDVLRFFRRTYQQDAIPQVNDIDDRIVEVDDGLVRERPFLSNLAVRWGRGEPFVNNVQMVFGRFNLFCRPSFVMCLSLDFDLSSDETG